jgi:SpoVK/Ycf46/Vps4 family AAA+-type ATPase
MAQKFRNQFAQSHLQNMIEQGPLALFSGPSGTGKTMAADIVARELGLSVYRVNLNQGMSKFIGETERNLARVLKTAEMKKSVLLFDEANALFGDRNRGKGSHDRYANNKGSYFLKVELLPRSSHIGFRFFEALHFAMVG